LATQLLKNAVVSLVTGLCFGAGVLAAVAIYKEVREARAPIVVDLPEGFDFPEHRREPHQPRFTVSGTVRNSSDKDWATVRIVASIYAGPAYMTYCWSNLDHVPAHSTRPFRVVCKNTEGEQAPDNVSYRLSVPRATLARVN
jgi:hypothetical protein